MSLRNCCLRGGRWNTKLYSGCWCLSFHVQTLITRDPEILRCAPHQLRDVGQVA